MESTFLVVVLIMVVLIGFMLVVLRSLSISAGIKVRADMVKLLESYDKIIDVKSQEIQKLQKDLESAKSAVELAATMEPVMAVSAAPVVESPQISAAAAVPKAADYRHNDFSGGYGSIRGHFYLSEQDKQALINQVISESSGSARGPLASELRKSLSYDTVYRLSQLPGDEQLRVLDTSLGDEEWTLLRDYCEERSDADFSITRFCEWLEEISILECGEIRIKSAEDISADGPSNICEGIQIMVGGKLYDYSINEKEIS